MRDDISKLTSIIAGGVILQVANGILGVLVPLRMGLSELPTTVIGAVITAYAIGFLIGCASAPAFIRPVGHIRAFAALAAALSIVSLVFTATDWPLLWIVLRFATGLFFAGLNTVIESWIAGEAPRRDRGRIISLYMISNKSALMLGQGLLAAGAASGPAFFVLACACFSASLIPVALTPVAEPTVHETLTLDVRTLYRIAPVSIVGCFGAGLVNTAVLGLAPVYGLGIGLSASAIPLLIVAAQLGSLVVQWPLGWLSDTIDRRYVIIMATGISAAASLAAATLGDLEVWVPFVMFGVWGGFSLSVYSVCIAHASDHVEPSQLVPVVSSLLMSWAAGSTIGPPIATMTMTGLGQNGLFFFAAAVALMVGGFAVWRSRRRPSVPAAQKEAFVNLPATSPVVAEITPGALHSPARPEAAPGEGHGPQGEPPPDRAA